MKLYYGGYGDYKEFTVAENDEEAIKKIGIKINAPFLPITVQAIENVDGHCLFGEGLPIPETGIGDVSDGYHTFNELYKHRCILFSVICSLFPAWKSKLHHDGTMYDGMFIVGIDTPEGQISYHYDMEYWNLFKARILEKAPEWDGSEDVLKRILSLKAVKKDADKHKGRGNNQVRSRSAAKV
jgi:hypothetical protein